MTSPRWARALLRFVTPGHRIDDVIGDLEESHRARRSTRGSAIAWIQTSVEAVDMSLTILRDRVTGGTPEPSTPEEASREGVLSALGASWLDFKLGFRMLVKYPGLTLVAGAAIAFTITLGTGTFELVRDFISPELPFDEGERIVEVRNHSLRNGNVDPRALHDFEIWKEELRTVEELGAFRHFRRNILTDRAGARPVLGAEITAAAFSLPRVQPFMGRLLRAEDEIEGAPHVFVLGHEVWLSHFGGDPDVVGTEVRVGSDRGTVVGVMPEDFRWPVDQEVWMPLRLDPLAYDFGRSPAITVAGRLAPGASIAQARAEVATVGRRTAADHPETHELLEPNVTGYGKVIIPMENVMIAATYSINAMGFVALVLLVCGNVALLLFARTAARQNEIVVRSALGASRGRIVAQLFVEALVLGGLSGLLGLWGADIGLKWVMSVLDGFGNGGLGFWFSGDLSGPTIVYALAFTLLASIVAGVLPALRITSADVQPRLQRAGSGGTGVEFGRLWSTIIVAQIAGTVGFVPIVVLLGLSVSHIQSAEYGFEADQFAYGELSKDEEIRTLVDYVGDIEFHPATAEYRESWMEIGRRLNDRPDMTSVTFARTVPGEFHARDFVEVEGPSAPYRFSRGHYPSSNHVDHRFFDALDLQIVSGRGFAAADVGSGNHVVVVNQIFVTEILEDRNAVGRTLWFNDTRLALDDPDRDRGPGYEIIGVVEQFAVSHDPEAIRRQAAVYLLLEEEEASPVRVMARASGGALAFGTTLREVANAVDPDMVVRHVRPATESAWQAEAAYGTWFWIVLGAGGIGLLLATAGIYAIMSFTVARRTREIGIRVALGADRRRIVSGIFAKALKQIGLGVGLGGLLAIGILTLPEPELVGDQRLFLLIVPYLMVMTAICGMACVIPTRRALAIEPTEALRAEG